MRLNRKANRLVMLTTSEGELEVSRTEWRALRSVFTKLPSWKQLMLQNYAKIVASDS